MHQSGGRKRVVMSSSTVPIASLEFSRSDDSEGDSDMKSGKDHPPTLWEKCIPSWKGKNEFFSSQIKVAAVLALARFGDRWEPSYPRNDNKNMNLFWFFHFILGIATVATWTHEPPRDPNSTRITLLSRPQTEEWKGWMQFSFIMYHYYRASSVYNWIRVFVSSYVWMTGFGNFLYFDKKKDFSIERMVSMWLRINYFPVLLSWTTGVSMDLYYVVPLHTVGFFITMATCWCSFKLENIGMSYWKSRWLSILLCLIVHVGFYETTAVNFLKFFSDEIHLRFQIDKYSAWVGIVCGLLMSKVAEYMSWAYGSETSAVVQWAQRFVGLLLILFWYYGFGYITEKTTYNPIHPYIFFFPVIGWLMIRNSSRYLTESHSTFLEFLGRNTLETYVLQFHLFMNHSVQYIPIVIPGSGPDGSTLLKILNMTVCSIIFLYTAIHARNITVSTQNTAVELVSIVSRKTRHQHRQEDRDEETQKITESESTE